MRVAIIGAGLVGVTIAHALLDEQHEVTLIDSEGPAAGASRGNAGMIAHVNILPLGAPKMWRDLPRWVADPLGPLAIRPSYLPKLAPWLWRFVKASRPSTVEHGTKTLIALNGLALPAWERRLDALRLQHHLRRGGFLSVWKSADGFAAARDVLARQAGLGIPMETLDVAAVRALEPAIRGPIAGGVLYESGCHVSDPRQLTLDLAEAAFLRQARFRRGRASAIAPTESGADVVFADGSRLDAEIVVLAAGAWSKRLAATLGDDIPLDTERGYNVTYPGGRFGLSRPVTFEGQGFVTSPLDIGDRVGGAVEFGGLDLPPNYARIDAILARLKQFLPDIETSGGERWMGFRPSLPDSLPVIGRSPRAPNVIHAFGHGHLGLTQSAATAALVAALIAGRAPDIDLAPFRPGRF